MPYSIISQPLPQDLRNWSFREMNCECWDFSGRDIRGCNFSNAKLNGANFSQVIAGRSQRQNAQHMILKAILAGLLTGPFTGTFIALGAGAGTGEFTSEDIAPFLSALIGVAAVIGAVTGAVIGVSAAIFADLGMVFAWIAIRSSSRLESRVAFAIIAVMFFWFALLMAEQHIREFQNSTGTSFRGANLQKADFSQATLNNCTFGGAEISYVNWSDAQGLRSDMGFTDIRMQLLISRNGKNGKYLELNLSDQNLANVELQHADLNGADLTRSNLQEAKRVFVNEY